MQHNSHFFLLKFSSVNDASIEQFFIGINLDRMSSRTYTQIPPPYSFRSNLKIQYPSI